MDSLFVLIEHEMEGKLQDHTQELEKMKQEIVLDRKKLLQETQLKKKVKEVNKCFSKEEVALCVFVSLLRMLSF